MVSPRFVNNVSREREAEFGRYRTPLLLALRGAIVLVSPTSEGVAIAIGRVAIVIAVIIGIVCPRIIANG